MCGGVASDVDALHSDRPARGTDQAGDDAHQRGLAGAVRADDADGLAGLHVEIDVEQRLERAIAGIDAAKLQHRLASRAAARFSRRGLRGLGIGAEIDLDDARIAGNRARQAFRDLLAVIEHHDAVDDAHQHAHDVLDPDDGDAEFVADVAQHVGRLVHLGLVETAEALIGKQKFWRGGERFRQFELLQAGCAEAIDAGVAIGRQAHHRERPLGRLLGLGTAMAALAVEAGKRDVLENGQAAKRPRNLEGAADAAVDDPVRREGLRSRSRRTGSIRNSAPACRRAC